jgi:hypothetical protein
MTEWKLVKWEGRRIRGHFIMTRKDTKKGKKISPFHAGLVRLQFEANQRSFTIIVRM